MFDVAMISADGVRPDRQVVGSVTSETILKRVAINRSKRSVLLATATKWRPFTGSIIASLEEFDTWLVDEANNEMHEACHLAGTELVETCLTSTLSNQFAT